MIQGSPLANSTHPSHQQGDSLSLGTVQYEYRLITQRQSTLHSAQYAYSAAVQQPAPVRFPASREMNTGDVLRTVLQLQYGS